MKNKNSKKAPANPVSQAMKASSTSEKSNPVTMNPKHHKNLKKSMNRTKIPLLLVKNRQTHESSFMCLPAFFICPLLSHLMSSD
ncbi:MAG: hypothetical protein E7256_04535 [Lachnospiraceae bacterium]|nr:hypothetical protein [Lachnospiraceae bacterium]